MNKFLWVLVVILVSCGKNKVVFSKSQEMDGTWDEKETVSFEIPPLDSLKTYNLYVNIRNTNDYPFNNVFLIVSMEFPHGKTIVDTLEYRMAHPDGSWMGRGIGNVKENKLWYKENVQFQEMGNYVVEIQQAVRKKGDIEGVYKLEGIADVGFTIEEN